MTAADDIPGLSDRLDAVEAVDLGTVGAAPVAPAASDTVLAVDRWGRRRAADIAKRWTAEGLAADEPVIADAHEALFAPEPQPAERPADERRAAWWRQLMNTPEYRALHQQTMLDPALSEIASAQICREWADYEQREAERQQGQGDAAQPGSDDEPIAATVARIRSTARALQQARDDVEVARATAAGLGQGDAQQLPTQQIVQYFRRVRSDPVLRAIMDAAGRMVALARSLQRQKVHAERGEITGIELSGDVSRLLPAESALVAGAVPELELLALYRLAQRRALSYRHQRVAPVGRGPIIVSVDESGSMQGQRIAAAKGLALALAWVAQHQRRWIMLAGFSGDAHCTRYVAAPGQSRPDDLIAWLTHMYGGGTVLHGPLATVPGWWPEVQPPRGQTDHVIITDAEVDLPADLRDSYRAFCASHAVKTYGIVIGSRRVGPLAEICARSWCLPDLSIDAAAVSEVLSI